jgi:hypothetical protein
LIQLTPNTAAAGSAGSLILRGTNFVADASISTPPGLHLRNIRVNSPTEIAADYAIAKDSYLGYFDIAVTTPGGTSDPIKFTILRPAFQFGVLRGSSANPATITQGPPIYESFDVGIHAGPVPNPDGSQTDAYLDVSFTDDKGHPVTIGGSYHSDMDNVSNPDDPDDGPPDVTSYSFGVQRPEAGDYVLRIKGSRVGSFTLEIDTTASSRDSESYESLANLDDVPTYPGSSFELNFICHRDPFSVNLARGGLQPPQGAFSFAQPLDSVVRLPSEAKVLGVVIYYHPVVDPSSFRALLDGSDVTGLFHVRPGELELVSIPLEPGQHHLGIHASAKSGLPTEQEFRIQR